MNKSKNNRTKKFRADILLVNQGITNSREEAKKLILAGKVRAEKDQLVAKPSDSFPENTKFIIEEPSQYVSRGALKLLPAIKKYPPHIVPFVAADIGSSTGGFTQVLLESGASKVYAVDVGTNQLHFSLKTNPKIISLEKTNARYLSPAIIPDKIQIATIDVSFISVKKIIPALTSILDNTATIYLLFKPQFEAERKFVKKGGIVNDPTVIQNSKLSIANFASTYNWQLLDTIPSPIKGPKGNQEEMMIFKYQK